MEKSHCKATRVVSFIKLWIQLCFAAILIDSSLANTNGRVFSFKNRADFLSFISDEMKFENDVPPDYDNDVPTKIACEIHVENFDAINEANMDFTVTLLLHLSWNDPRFELYQIGSLSENYVELDAKNLNRLWVPDLYFTNEKNAYYHNVLMPNKMLRIYRGGKVTYSTRLSLTLSCPMDFRNYPFDKQRCKILLESFSYNEGNIILTWQRNGTDPVILRNANSETNVSLPQFEVMGIRTEEFTRHRRGSGNHSGLSVEFTLVRNVGYYLVQMYIPSVLVVMLSWISFWLNVNAVPGRISLGVLTVLTMTTQSSGVNASLPHVSYTKAIDIWMSTCLMFVFLALIEFAVANVLVRKDTYKGFRFTSVFRIPKSFSKKNDDLNQQSPTDEDPESCPPKTRKRTVSCGVRWAMYIDVSSRMVFPALFAIFNIVYWSHFVTQLNDSDT